MSVNAVSSTAAFSASSRVRDTSEENGQPMPDAACDAPDESMTEGIVSLNAWEWLAHGARIMRAALNPAHVIELGSLERGSASQATASEARSPSGPAQASPVACTPAVGEDTYEDKPYEQKSPVGARVATMRELLGAGAQGHDDEQLLDLANEVHRAAAADRSDKDAERLSMTLWNEESLRWARAMGGDATDASSRLSAYTQLWALALDPPRPPDFKTRAQFAAEYSAALPPSARSLDDVNGNTYKGNPEVLAKYYGQFKTYIETHLDRFCELTALLKAEEAGESWLSIHYKPKPAWAISVVTHYKHVYGLLLGTRHEDNRRSFVFQLPDGASVFLDWTGNLQRLPKRASNERNVPWSSVVIRAYGLPPTPPTSERQHFMSSRRIDAESFSIKDMQTQVIKTRLLAAIEACKEKNYEASLAENALDLIPFYEVFRKWRHDPGYTVKFEDVALDVVDTVATLGSIGLAAAGGYKGIRMSIAAARAVAARGSRAMANAALKSALARFKGGTFLATVGRELTDFVVPVFSAKDLLHASVPRASAATAERLRGLLRSSNSSVRAAPPGRMLDSIYRVLARSQAAGFNISAADLRKFIDSAANEPVPLSLFRGQAYEEGAHTLRVPGLSGVGVSRDDYLAACIKHSSRVGGGIDAPMSLSANKSVAHRFAKARKGGRLFTIDTSRDTQNFRRIENIIKYDGPRLVAEGKITPGTLRAAIKNAFIQEEKEIFYLFGNIPDTFITAID